MAPAQMLLVQNVHRLAFQELEAGGVKVESLAPGSSSEEIRQALARMSAQGPVMLGIRSKSQIDAEVIRSCPGLVAIGAFCIGTDQIDLDCARERGVAVFNAPFSNTRSVAELVLGEMIMLARQIMPKNRAAHEGRWAKSSKGAHELRNKTLGIIGYGHIGSQLSVLAESLGMRVVFYDIEPKLPLGNAQRCGSFEDVLKVADVLSFHVPDTPLTQGMLDQKAMSLLKTGSWVINASRGCVVDLDALAAMLKEGKLAGAAIDVYPNEPSSAKEAFHCPLRGLDQVILTPHIGGSTAEAQENIALEVSASLLAFLDRGSTVRNHALPSMELPKLRSGLRLINLHQNVAGAASAINQLLARRGINIEAQQLATRASIGMMSVDFQSLSEKDSEDLLQEVESLPASVRSRVLRATSCSLAGDPVPG